MNGTQPFTHGYIVHDFFAKELRLKPTEQLLFGIILSFSKKGGDFSGSQTYLAERMNVSTRTVTTTLAALTERGYIVKTENPRSALTPCYRVCSDLLSRLGEEPTSEKTASLKFCGGYRKNLHSTYEEISDNNKSINKSIIKNNNHNNNALTREDSPSGVLVNRKKTGAKNPTEERDPEDDILYIGKDRIVFMTYRQYHTLFALVGEEVLDDYLARAENYATQGVKPGSHVYSFYNTIRGWLKADLGV